MEAELRDIPFVKMTGSGNDFVVFDARQVNVPAVTRPAAIRAICDRHNGIGADGVVVLEAEGSSTAAAVPTRAAVRILYFNSDGSAADLCGNATLCSAALASMIGLASADGMGLITPSGVIEGQVVDGQPEIALPPVHSVVLDAAVVREAGESRVGFAIAGIPHLVVACDDVEAIDVEERGAMLRWHPAGGPTGANVNWVSSRPDGSWRYRTFERGVEGETLACGTGAVATAVLLTEWQLGTSPVRLITSSGRPLDVTLERRDLTWSARLRGEGRVVFRGEIGELSR